MLKTTLIGNLVNDPVLRNIVTSDGRNGTVCNFRVACNQSQGKVTYVNVRCWDTPNRLLGTNCATYLSKGRGVYIEGAVSASAGKGKDEKIYANLDLTATMVQFLGGRPAAEAEPAPAAEAVDAQQAPAVAAAPAPAPAAPAAPAPVAMHTAPAQAYTPAPAQVAQMPSPNPRRNQPAVPYQESMAEIEAQMASELPF